MSFKITSVFNALDNLKPSGFAETWFIRWLDPNVDQYVMHEGGEQKLLEIPKHWAASFWAFLRLLLGTAVLILSFGLEHWWSFYPVLTIASILIIRSWWVMLDHYRDRMVITNQQAMRVHGVLGSDRPSVQISRLINFRVIEPWWGKRLNYGHLVLDSAADDEGLQRCRFVKNVRHAEKVIKLAVHGESADSMVLEIDPDDGT
jgi:hypothetical protein